MKADEVIEVVDRLEAAGIWYCIEGGWGVDALLETQTRDHDDLDFGVRLEDVDRLCAAFADFERDHSEWPSTLWLRDPSGRRLDCSPLTFDANGDGWQASLCGEPHRWPREHLEALGGVGGRRVRCISTELQLRWHAYEGLDNVDWADMRALAVHFGLKLPDALASRPGFVASKRGSAAKGTS